MLSMTGSKCAGDVLVMSAGVGASFVDTPCELLTEIAEVRIHGHKVLPGLEAMVIPLTPWALYPQDAAP